MNNYLEKGMENDMENEMEIGSYVGVLRVERRG